MTEPALREGFLSREALVRILVAWAVVALASCLHDIPAIRDIHFADQDDTLRLIQVRNLLNGQSWFDLHQYRIDPPHGVLMHWSRLVDVPIAAFILLLRPFLGDAGAEQAAMVIVPLLTLLVAQLLTGRIAWKLFGARIAGISCFIWLFLIPTMIQLKPLRIDHHGWQIVAVVGALSSLLEPNPRRGGWIAGGAMAFGMSVSLELLPFCALFAGVFGLRWLADREERGWLVSYLQALAIAGPFLFLATHGTADLVNHCDSLGPAYLAGFVVAAVATTGTAALPSLPRVGLACLLAVAVSLATATFLALAPQCMSGPFAQLDPLVRSLWYDKVLEAAPVWRQAWPIAVQIVVPPLAGFYAALSLALRTQGSLRRFWVEYALLLCGALAIAIAVTRFGGVACAMATVPLGWQFWQWAMGLRDVARQPFRLLPALAIVVIAVPGVTALAIERLVSISGGRPRSDGAEGTPAMTRCGMPSSLDALRQLPPATIFAPMDMGPWILYKSDHRVVATGHHRASSAMHDVIAAFIAPPDQAHAIVLRHGAQYVLSCAELGEAQSYQRESADGLMAQLNAGRAPAWLEPVPLANGGTLRLWRVKG